MSAEMTVEGMISVFMKIRKVYADEFGRMLGNETYSPNEISILLFLANNPSINTNSQLCTCLGVSKALVCRSVDALLGKEMIISVADDHDKRVQHLKLTEHALPVIEQLGGIKRKIDQEILEGIPEEDIANMANTMEKIFARFEERAKGKESIIMKLKMSKEVDLGKEPIGHLLFVLAVPSIISQVVNALYNMVDRMYIGHIPGEGAAALTGLGVCFPVIMIVSAFAALMGMGGAPRASILMGKKDNEGAEKILGNCFSALVITAVVLTALVLVFKRPLLMMFGASENTIGYAESYLNIYAVGTIFVQLTLGLNAFIAAQGFSKISMMTVVIGAVTNIVLDPIFIFGI